MKDLEKLLMKKKKDGPEMDEKTMQAKEEILMELIEEMMDMRGKKLMGDMEGMKKVTVASPSKEGLEEGLEKAKEMMEMKEEMSSEGEEEETEEESSEMMPEMKEESKSEEDMEEEKPKKKKLFSME